MITAFVIALSIIGYLTGWLGTTVAGARWYANGIERCHGRDRRGMSYTWRDPRDCRRWCEPGCWHADGVVTVKIISQASVVALLWPVLLFPATAYWMATRTPTPAGLRTRVAELEKELGIGGDQ